MERRASLGVAALEKLGGTLGVRRASQVASAVNHQGARSDQLLLRSRLTECRALSSVLARFWPLPISVSRTWLEVQWALGGREEEVVCSTSCRRETGEGGTSSQSGRVEAQFAVWRVSGLTKARTLGGLTFSSSQVRPGVRDHVRGQRTWVFLSHKLATTSTNWDWMCKCENGRISQGLERVEEASVGQLRWWGSLGRRGRSKRPRMSSSLSPAASSIGWRFFSFLCLQLIRFLH